MRRCLSSIIIITLLFNVLANLIYSVKAELLEEDNGIVENITDNIVDDNTAADNNIADNTTDDDKDDNEVIGDDSIIDDEDIEDNEEEENNIPDEIIEDEIFEENEITAIADESPEFGVEYRTHVQNEGWQAWKQNGQMSGTEGKSYRLEGINIKLKNNSSDIKIKYQVHVQNEGWQTWKTDGEMAGTEGKSYRLEGIKIELENTEEYSIMYRVHVQNVGWQAWKTDGEMAGTEGMSLRLEGIEIKIVPKIKKALIFIDSPVNGSVHYNPQTITVSGWKMANVSNTKMKIYIDDSSTPLEDSLITYRERNDVIASIKIGTAKQNPKPGFSVSLDSINMSEGTHTIKIVVYTSNDEKLQEATSKVTIDRKLHVQYRSHVQNVGWQGYALDGNLSGTTYRNLRVEAMNIDLINAPENAKIKYRTQIQNIGWQSWKENGQLTGTEGQGLRIEALQIKLENLEQYTVEYRVHVEGIGWTGWYMDGETAGTVGQSRRIEAIQIRLVPFYKRMYKGIDVSQFNGDINWALVKRSGVEFAMIRIGYRGYGQAGNFRLDSKFLENITGAKQAGIPVGVYFVTQAITDIEAVEEANWVVGHLRDNNITLDYPIALDIEAPGKENPNDVGRAEHLDVWTRSYLAQQFCITIQNKGYIPMIYTNVNWANNKLNMSMLANYDTWIASYRNVALGPGYDRSYAMWQYTSSGTVNGIYNKVDLNYCYKKY